VRSADSFAHWLGFHPQVEVTTRDRSSLYADGGRQGATSAVQITDRYHLVSNLSEAVERDIQQCRSMRESNWLKAIPLAQERQSD
jgi:transposase